jgi:hypothetical protein
MVDGMLFLDFFEDFRRSSSAVKSGCNDWLARSTPIPACDIFRPISTISTGRSAGTKAVPIQRALRGYHERSGSPHQGGQLESRITNRVEAT